ncbi:MAG: hypothetical protein AAF862_11175, partial [Pseudomonadota bacterium]
MLMDEKTQDLPKVAMSLSAEAQAQSLAKFSTTSAPDSSFRRSSRRVPLWLQALLPFGCIALAVGLLGQTTHDWIVAGITGAAAFIALSAFFAIAIFGRLRGQAVLKKDILIAAVEANTAPVAITDLQGALVCANSAYGRLLDGFPSPGSLPTSDQDRAAVTEATQSARVCGRGTARISQPSRDNPQPLNIVVKRSKQIENYLVWEIEGAGQEAQIQQFLDLCENGLAAWLSRAEMALFITDGRGHVRYASELMRSWTGGLDQPLNSYTREQLISAAQGSASLLNGAGQPIADVTASAHDLRAHEGAHESAGTVYFVQKQSTGASVAAHAADVAQAVFNDAPVGMAVVDQTGDFLRR